MARGLAILSGLLGGLGGVGKAVDAERERERLAQEKALQYQLHLRQTQRAEMAEARAERAEAARREAEFTSVPELQVLLGKDMPLPSGPIRRADLRLALPELFKRAAEQRTEAREATDLSGLAKAISPTFEVAPEGAMEVPSVVSPSPARGGDIRRRLGLAQALPSLGLAEGRKRVGELVSEKTPEEEMAALRGVMGLQGGESEFIPSFSLKGGKVSTTFRPPTPGVHVPFPSAVQKQKVDISAQQGAGTVRSKEEFDFKQRQAYAQLAINRIEQIREEVAKNPRTIGLPGAATSLAMAALSDVKGFGELLGIPIDLPTSVQAYESSFAKTAVQNEIQKSQILGIAMLVAAAEKFEGREMTEFKMKTIIERLGAASHNPQAFAAVLDQFSEELDTRFQSYAKGVLGRDIPTMRRAQPKLRILDIQRVP